MLSQVIQTGGHHSTQALLDFDLLLGSILPHKQFTEFLRSDKPDLLPYLLVIRKTKLLKAK